MAITRSNGPVGGIGGIGRVLGRSFLITAGVAVAAVVATLVLRAAGTHIPTFVASGVGLAALAVLVGHSTDQLGHRLGAGATGVIQSALGNLPELFIGFFALRAGLVTVVQTALVGSILANALLVLGLAFLAGGFKHGVQRFGTEAPRLIASLLVLAVAALVIPSLATSPGAPDFGHAGELSVLVSLVLLLIFAASIPFSVRSGSADDAAGAAPVEHPWPMGLTLGTLLLSGAGAALMSDWFVEALSPSMAQLHIAEGFVGLVIVAIAGNAVENVVGIQMAMRNKPDLAISLILNSALQVALVLTPVLVILSALIGGPQLTLVLSPLLLGSLALTAVLAAFITYDGESNWVEGVALIGLYVIIAAAFWWGPSIAP